MRRIAEKSVKSATISDVARKAGVSIATVSYVMNGTKHIQKETVDKVYQAIRQLNYQPSMAARSLMTKSTQIIGVLVSDISNPFFSPIVRGIEDIASKIGYVVMVGNSDEEYSKMRKYIDVLAGHRVDGLIISPISGFEELETTLKSLDMPMVLVNRRVQGIQADIVETDNELGAYQAIQHLCSLGHKRIALISGPTEVSTYSDRLNGYKKALAQVGLPEEEELIRIGQYDYASGYRICRELFGLPNKPSAIFVSSGWLAQGVFLAVRESGIKVPEELSLVMYDETEWAPLVDPPLTTVAQDTYKMGQLAAILLLNKLGKQLDNEMCVEWDHYMKGSKRSEDRYTIRLSPRLIVRDSTMRKG